MLTTRRLFLSCLCLCGGLSAHAEEGYPPPPGPYMRNAPQMEMPSELRFRDPGTSPEASMASQAAAAPATPTSQQPPLDMQAPAWMPADTAQVPAQPASPPAAPPLDQYAPPMDHYPADGYWAQPYPPQAGTYPPGYGQSYPPAGYYPPAQGYPQAPPRGFNVNPGNLNPGGFNPARAMNRFFGNDSSDDYPPQGYAPEGYYQPEPYYQPGGYYPAQGYYPPPGYEAAPGYGNGWTPADQQPVYPAPPESYGYPADPGMPQGMPAWQETPSGEDPVMGEQGTVFPPATTGLAPAPTMGDTGSIFRPVELQGAPPTE